MRIQIITKNPQLEKIAFRANGLANRYNFVESSKLISGVLFAAATTIAGIVQATLFSDTKNESVPKIFGLISAGLPVIAGVVYTVLKIYQGTVALKIKAELSANQGLQIVSDIKSASAVSPSSPELNRAATAVDAVDTPTVDTGAGAGAEK